jgi:hypothetical protein
LLAEATNLVVGGRRGRPVARVENVDIANPGEVFLCDTSVHAEYEGEKCEDAEQKAHGAYRCEAGHRDRLESRSGEGLNPL